MRVALIVALLVCITAPIGPDEATAQNFGPWRAEATHIRYRLLDVYPGCWSPGGPGSRNIGIAEPGC